MSLVDEIYGSKSSSLVDDIYNPKVSIVDEIYETKNNLFPASIAQVTGGKVPSGYRYNEMGNLEPVGKGVIQPGMDEPIPRAKNVIDFAGRVFPESAYRTAVGIPKFLLYDVGKTVTDPLVRGMQRAIGGQQDTPENVGQVAKELAVGGGSTVQGVAEFTTRPLGLTGEGWSLETLKEAWLSDPVGSALGLTPFIRLSNLIWSRTRFRRK